MVSLLENTLCVGDKEIIFGPGDVSWTLGAALVEGKDLWLSVEFMRFPLSCLLTLCVMMWFLYGVYTKDICFMVYAMFYFLLIFFYLFLIKRVS
ncbi:putative nucleoside phosphatase GDA1/CD39, SWEET sugar transporter [Helianthus anomalus]